MNTSKIKRTALIGASMLTAMLAGCSVQDKTSAEKAAEIANKLTYVKDKYGLCYATIGSYSYGANIVTSITAVPCEKVGL